MPRCNDRDGKLQSIKLGQLHILSERVTAVACAIDEKAVNDISLAFENAVSTSWLHLRKTSAYLRRRPQISSFFCHNPYLFFTPTKLQTSLNDFKSYALRRRGNVLSQHLRS
jgi:hypothetical protein